MTAARLRYRGAVAAVASWEEQLPHQLSAMLDDLPVVERWPRFLVIDFFARLVPRADAGPIHAQRMRYARSRPKWWAAQACAARRCCKWCVRLISRTPTTMPIGGLHLEPSQSFNNLGCVGLRSRHEVRPSHRAVRHSNGVSAVPDVAELSGGDAVKAGGGGVLRRASTAGARRVLCACICTRCAG